MAEVRLFECVCPLGQFPVHGILGRNTPIWWPSANFCGPASSQVGFALGLAYVDSVDSRLENRGGGGGGSRHLGDAVQLCPVRARATFALLAVAVVLLAGTAWIQVTVILLGLLAG